jgi:hypothetical protein
MVPAVKELWEQSILPYNLPFTILLGLVVCFWLLSLAGAVSTDSLHIDTDTDLDMHMDADADGHADLGDLPGMLLRVVNAGYVPLTIVISVLALAMWILSILLNYYYNPAHSGWRSLAFMAAAFVGGVIVTKIVTQPLVPFMRRLKEAEDVPPVIGALGVVRSIQLDSSYGQVEVQRVDGAPALLNARLGTGCEPVFRGATVAVVSQDELTGTYVVRPVPITPASD